MSYTYDLGTNVGKIRNLINDTTEATALLSDEEITSILSQTENDILRSAAMACRKIASKYALSAFSVSAGNYSENKSGISKMFLELAKDFEEQSQAQPGSASAEVIYTDFNYNQLLEDKVHRQESLDV